MLMEMTDYADWSTQTGLLFCSAGLSAVPLSVNFKSEHSISPYDKVEQTPAGTKIDVYLVSFPIAVITIASSLSCTSLMLSFSESDNTIR